MVLNSWKSCVKEECPMPCFNGGSLCKRIVGENKDEDVANEWYHKSAELGCDAAKGALTDLPF